MIYLFYLVAITGLFYFLVAKRRPDAFLVAFFSALVYFLPAFFGYVIEPDPLNYLIPTPLEDEAYIVYVAVTGLIFGSALVSDALSFKWPRPKTISGENSGGADIVFIALLISLAIVVFAGYDPSIHSDDKHEMMEGLPYLHKHLVLLSVFAALFFFLKKRYVLLALSLVFIGWDVYVGFRSRAAFFLIGALMIYMYNLGPVRVLGLWRINLVALLAGIFMFSYKGVYLIVKRGEYYSAFDRFFSMDGVRESVVRSEPFTIQATLNKVMREEYRIPLESIGEQFLAIMPFSRTFLGFEASGFNDFFQPDLFPGLTFGMAHNWWAYWYSAIGWAGVLLAIIIVLSGCFLVNTILGSRSPLVVAVGGSIASIWLFYIHRNDILFTFGHIFQLVFYFGVLAFSIMMLHSLLSLAASSRERCKVVGDKVSGRCCTS